MDINSNDGSQGRDSPVSVATGMRQHVDELRSHRSVYCLRFPGSTHRHPRSVFGNQIAENHIPGGYLLHRLADHRYAKSRRDKGEGASGAIRLLGNSRFESHAPYATCFPFDARTK